MTNESLLVTHYYTRYSAGTYSLLGSSSCSGKSDVHGWASGF